jgi:hypothetical protein
VIPVADDYRPEVGAMMGLQRRDQGRLFYEFRLEDRIPENHLLRRMNVFVMVALTDLGQARNLAELDSPVRNRRHGRC